MTSLFWDARYLIARVRPSTTASPLNCAYIRDFQKKKKKKKKKKIQKNLQKSLQVGNKIQINIAHMNKHPI
jgi:hypothetical protein